MNGFTIGPYEVESEIGRGGMGRVFRARHAPTGAVRALKLLESSGNFEALARFQREAEALARVGGRVAVTVHETGSERGRPWYAMDLMACSLKTRIEKGPLPWREAVELTIKLAKAIGRCHAAGLVHRDLKPANILFDESGEPRIADFGCVRDLEAETLTHSGQTIGSPAYMAPEQLEGKRGDARTDVYALASMLHEMLAGRPLRAGMSWSEVIEQAMGKLDRPLARAVGAPRELDLVIEHALEPLARDRTPTGAALARELEALLAGEPWPKSPASRRRSRRGLALAGGAVLSIAALVAALASREPDGRATPRASLRPTPSWTIAFPLDEAFAEQLRHGQAPPGSLEELERTERGRSFIEHDLVEHAVIFPLERVAPFERGHHWLEVLRAIAVIASSTSDKELDAALKRLASEPAPVLWKLGNAVKSAREAVVALAVDLRKDTLKVDHLKPFEELKGRPDLVAIAARPLGPICRHELAREHSVVGDRVSKIIEPVTVFNEALGELPPAVAFEFAHRSPLFAHHPQAVELAKVIARRSEEVDADACLAAAGCLIASNYGSTPPERFARIARLDARLAAIAPGDDDRPWSEWLRYEIARRLAEHALTSVNEALRGARPLAEAIELTRATALLLDTWAERARSESVRDTDRHSIATLRAAVALATGEKPALEGLSEGSPIRALAADPINEELLEKSCDVAIEKLHEWDTDYQVARSIRHALGDGPLEGTRGVVVVAARVRLHR